MRKMAKGLVLLLVLTLALTGCKESKVPEKVLQEENVYTFSDGEQVSTWRFMKEATPTYESGEGSEGKTTWRFGMDSKLIYQLSDGTELLATRFTGQEQAMPESVEGFEELSQVAQDNIIAFYRKMGAMYDLEAYLEQAYAEYQENPKEFRCYLLTQESAISATEEDTVTCTTSVSLPEGHGEYKSDSVLHVFDRKTGELVEE